MIKTLGKHIKTNRKIKNQTTIRRKEKKRKEEHVFVYCKISVDIWKDVLNWWQITNTQFHNLHDVIHMADHAPIVAKHSRFFDVVVQTTIWCLWKFRNEVTFSVKRPSKDLLFCDIKLLSYTWVSSRGRKSCLNGTDWYV